MSPTPRWGSSLPDEWASASTSSASVGCCGPARASGLSSTSWSSSDPVRPVRPKGGGSVLLSERDLPLRVIEERAFIDYLGPQDEPWVRVLLAEMARFEGRRRRELAERLAEPLPCEAPHFKRRAASRALLALWRREPGEGPASRAAPARSLPRPAALRQELFGTAAATE